jgi:hypothetical protein
MKVLEVNYDDGYGALNFEQSDLTFQEVVQFCEKNSGHYTHEDEESPFEATLYEFNFSVSSFEEFNNFVDLIIDIIGDYDMQKNHNFYIVSDPTITN